jgi:ligand-binding sensor domain-containing protein/signal transduction histidine kinase/DNA-binding response OmpR family regulator
MGLVYAIYRSKHIQKWGLLLLFYLFHFTFYSQQSEGVFKDLKFKHLSLEDGMSQSSILCVLQDQKGFMWFGTRDGLDKFDGYNFTTYRHKSNNKNSLSNSSIKSLFEDVNGNLWVGTLNGLNLFDPEAEIFENFLPTDNEFSISNKEIRSIIKADEDHLWIGTNNGLEKLNITTKRFTHYKHKKNNSNSLSSNQIRALLQTDEDHLWIYTTKSIDLYNLKKKQFKHYKYPKTVLKSPVLNYVPTIYKDRNANLWLGFKNGLAIFNKEKDAFELFQLQNKKKQSITDEVRSIHENQDGNLWVGTYNGLYIINKTKTEISHIIHNENIATSLSQNSIYKIFEDQKKDIWIGTYSGGVNYYDRNYNAFKVISSGIHNTKLNYKVTSSIVEDENQNLWIGTEGGGLNFLNTTTGHFSYFTHDKNAINGLTTNNIKAVIHTKKGNLWIGTHEGGLLFFNPKKNPVKFKKYLHTYKDINTISHNRIISLFEDVDSNIWVGTSGGGLNFLDINSDRIIRLENVKNVVGGVIYSIIQATNKNQLYIGGSKGLAVIDIKSKKVSPIIFRKKNVENYTEIPVLSLYKDQRGNLWVGTEGDGLYCYDLKEKTSVKYGVAQGFPNEVIYGIVEDDYNTLWISTNKGLVRLSLVSKKVKVFDFSDGLQANEFNFNSYLKRKNGDLVFGGVNGINMFDPQNIKLNTFIPPISISSILVNNKLYPIKENISLTHKQNVFSFNFVALNYSQSEKNQFAYKLVGFDENWNYIGTKKTVTYTNLDAGKYVFKVKASNNDSVWNEDPETQTITILPAPWKSPWAYFIYIVFSIAILLAIRKYSLLRIYEKNELKQERIEKERIEEVNRMKLQLFTNISHDFRTPLTLIIGPLGRLIKAGKGDDFVKRQLSIMHNNSNVLLELINQFLDFRKNETGKLKIRASKNDLVSFLIDIKLSFNDLAAQRNIFFKFNYTEEETIAWFDVVNFRKVIYNLLSNAFKNTQDGGKIIISLVTKMKENDKEKQIVLKIKDNGQGISKDQIEFIFERYFQLENSHIDSGTGIGLALTKSIVELHRGTIEAKSKEGEGTTFIIKIQLGKAHFSEEQIVSNSAVEENNDVLFVKRPSTIDQENIVTNKNLKENKEDKTTILVVEDNRDVRAFVKDIFEDDYKVFEAETGKEAIRVAESNSIDLIISDIMMPEMDGIELCNYIKTNLVTSHIPVLLLTAKTTEEYREIGYKTGADAYITKPFNASLLRIRVINLLESRKNLILKFKKDVLLQPKDIAPTSTDELFLKKAIKIVDENIYNSDFSVDLLVTEMHMSRSVVYRKIKALTNQSLLEFIKVIKLKRAGQLLIKTDMSISEITFDLGYSSLKHFRNSFKDFFHEVPSKYRSLNK